MYKLCVITTVPSTIKVFIQDRIEFLRTNGFEVTVITARDENFARTLTNARYVPVPFSRTISPLTDLITLFKIYNTLRKGHFDIVQYATPKAALLGSIAGWLARVPVRLYLMWGLYYVTQTGIKRKIFKSFSKVICWCSTNIAPDSKGNVKFAVEEGLCPAEKIAVVGNGCANGVDMERFDPVRLTSARQQIRKEVGIDSSAIVFGFIGSIVRDKGINELLAAFSQVAEHSQNTYLLLIGNTPEKNPITAASMKMLSEHPRIIKLDWQDKVENYLAAMDIFVLPTYREGFGMVNVEAGAMELPVISTDVPGPHESIVHRETGLLVPAKTVEPLAAAMQELLDNPAFGRKLGAAARKRVQTLYERKLVWSAIVQHRRALLKKAGIINDHIGSVCVVTTVSLSIKMFYPGQLDAMNAAGLRTTVICMEDKDLYRVLPPDTTFIPVGLTRTNTPIKDMQSLWKLYRIFRKNKFDIVQYSTPKASLLAAIAAWAARTPIRIYKLWGLYYTGETGWRRTFYKRLEKIICAVSSIIVPISKEMVGFLEDEKITKREKCTVICNGSACGVDLEMFDPAKWTNYHDEIRNKYDIPANAIVIGAVARLTGDKGINELVKAFDTLSQENAGLYLLLVGEQEEKDRLLRSTERIINENNRIRVAGWQDDPRPFYAAMDIFCLPTYREGFGEVNLEAQAMGLPVVSTDVVGPRESVEDSVTGFLVEPKSAEALIAPLKKLIKDTELRKKMGSAGRLRVEKMFDRKDIIRAVVKHRLQLLSELRRK